jgi:hypothetical protein
MIYNLHLIQGQPRWRVAVVALFAKAVGVCVHVEGFPFGSSRKRRNHLAENSLAGLRHEA